MIIGETNLALLNHKIRTFSFNYLPNLFQKGKKESLQKFQNSDKIASKNCRGVCKTKVTTLTCERKRESL